ncbi:MAG: hypothetical protein NT040_07255 [Bacteroidetes bacterium]|nr:hypothetical protein [Bacteroidota bacterium]
MRKFILIAALAFFGMYGFSQQLAPSQVPQNVKDRLQAKFPQTIEIPVDWSKEQGNYKASLTIMDSPAFMVLDSLGRTVRIERKIHESYLPKKAKAKLYKLDPNYTVVNVMQVTDSKEKISYKAVVKITNNFSFDTEGNTIPAVK